MQFPPDEGDEDEAPAPARPLRRGPRSLTSKLVIGVVALVMLLVLLISVGTYVELRSFLNQKLDQQLASTVNQGLREILQDSSTTPAPLKTYVVGIDPEVVGSPYLPSKGSDGLEPMRLTLAQREKLAEQQSGGQPFTIMTTNGQELRAQVVPDVPVQILGVPNRITVIVGLSTHEERDTLHRLVLLEIVIGGGALIIAVLFTTYGVEFGLRQLRRVTTTAQEVAAELSPEGTGLDRRVPDDEPDTEVGQLATSFNTMLAAVETQFAARLESERRMRQFLADASHELRTPLTSIRGYAELARMKRAVGDASDDNLDRIESEGTRMSRLVEDLLLLARGDSDGSSRTRRELVDVDVVVDDAVSGSRAAFPERQITADVPGTLQVIGDPDQLVRVLRNLITNAAVHTAPGRPVAVRGRRDDADVVIQVVDGGPGLPPDEASQVFERFWRADKARTRARGGSGLGMSIVDTIVRAHGGSVRFDSTVETGSTVTVVLPAVD